MLSLKIVTATAFTRSTNTVSKKLNDYRLEVSVEINPVFLSKQETSQPAAQDCLLIV